jgi:3',5'-nucleoside bisphosphate phosphatase
MDIHYDLHIHSALSPCAENDMTPGNIVGMAYLNGLDLISLTDHQSCANVRAAMAAAEMLRAEYGKAPVIVPGMEFECAEGFHILGYFPDIGSAEDFEEYLRPYRLIVRNRPEIFGEQYLFNEKDEISGTVEDLLLTATNLRSEILMDQIDRAGGIFVPAHIDRDSYSMLASLGSIPEDFKGHILEISKNCDDAAFRKRYPETVPFMRMKNSDAHRLSDISYPGEVLTVPDDFAGGFDASALVGALRKNMCR